MNPAKLLVACRSESKGKSAVSGLFAHYMHRLGGIHGVKEIETATGFNSCEACKIDIADFASVTSFVENLQWEYDRLDIFKLVMNAAVLAREYEQTVDGWELRSAILSEDSLQVNHLARHSCRCCSSSSCIHR